MFKLFRLKTKDFEWNAWVNPEGICFASRAHTTNTSGLRWNVIVPDITGNTIKELKAQGFKETKTDMSQEALARVWLI